MGIQPHEYDTNMAQPSRPPVSPSTSTSKRLKRIFAAFKIVFANHKMNRQERLFMNRYALQIGLSKNNARKVIQKSAAMFTGDFDFEDYDNFVKR